MVGEGDRIGVVSGPPDLVVVVAGGPTAPIGGLELPRADLVIAADSGLHHALALGLQVDVLVGDLDSADPDLVARHEGRIVRHSTDKDATDLELALDEAVAHRPRQVFVIASAEGRLDHALAGLLLLAKPAYAGVVIDAVVDRTLVHVVHGRRRLAATPGELLTLVAVGGRVELERTEGLRWPLVDDVLLPSSTRGVSNIAVADEVEISLRSGTLLALRPAPPAADW